MSLVGTLAKVAVGAMVAKGVSGALKGGGGGGLGGLLGSALGGAKQQGGGGLGDLLAGAAGQRRQGGGGLGDLLGSALGGQRGGMQGGQGGGLGDLLGAALGGGAQQGGAAGGLGGLLDALGGGQQGGGGGGLGDLLNSALQGKEQPSNPTAEQQAEVCLRAMLIAARADGQIDAAEQQKITGQLGDMSDEEANFIRNEMANPTDLNSFVRSVPQGMEQQVYLMSLLAIDLDTQEEAQFLDRLAKGMNIDPQTSNAIHQKLGVPALYS